MNISILVNTFLNSGASALEFKTDGIIEYRLNVEKNVFGTFYNLLIVDCMRTVILDELPEVIEILEAIDPETVEFSRYENIAPWLVKQTERAPAPVERKYYYGQELENGETVYFRSGEWFIMRASGFCHRMESEEMERLLSTIWYEPELIVDDFFLRYVEVE